MKTILFASAMSLCTLTAFATPGNPSTSSNKASSVYVSNRAFENLKLMYGNVGAVEWLPAANNMVKANISFGDENFSVFFNQQGDFLASTATVAVMDLPLRLRKAIEDKFGDSPIYSLFELNTDEEQAWYFESYNKKGKKIVWKAYENGRIEEFYF